jgi:hypothetical protein
MSGSFTGCLLNDLHHSKPARQGGTTSAADLKSLHCKRRVRPRDFKSKAALEGINLLVSMTFRVREKADAATARELRKVDTRNSENASTLRNDLTIGYRPAYRDLERAAFAIAEVGELIAAA